MPVRKMYELELRRKRTAVDLPSGPIRMSSDAAALAAEIIGDLATERFVVIFLDARNRPIGFAEVARGTSNSVGVTPGDIFRPAFMAGAVTIIVAHNHPSGDVTPSEEDVQLTRRLLEACKLVGLPLMDHVIVSDDRHYSFQISSSLFRH